MTRVQAFLHSVRRWRETGADGAAAVAEPQEGADFSAVAAAAAGRAAAQDATGAGMQARLARLDRRLPHSLDAGYDRFIFGHVGGGLGRHLAAAMRGAGYDAVVRRRARRRCPARRRRRLLRQGVPAVSAHLGQLRPLPRPGGAAARRQEGALPQRRQRLPGVSRQPLPAHRADLARPARPRRSRRGRRLQPGHRQRAHDARRLDGAGGRRPAQHAPLLQLRRRVAAGRERRAVQGVLRPAGDDARAAPPGRRPRRQRDRGLPLLQSGRRSCSEKPPVPTGRCRATRRGRRICATSTSAATCTCAWTSGATTTCSASWPVTGCASSSSPTARSSSCSSSARSRTAWPLTKRPEKEATLATMRYVIGRLVKAVRAEHPWVFWNEVRDVDRESRRLVAPYPFGESIPTVGGALLTWRTQPIDGVVVGGAERVRAGPDRRSSASSRGRPPGSVRLRRRRPDRRGPPGRLRLAAPQPACAAPAGRAAALQGSKSYSLVEG